MKGEKTANSGRRSDWLEAAGLLAVAALCAWWTWLKWADELIDFGRELYIPWRLATGAALYRDIAYFNGPLSPHLNALWFWLFGVSIRTLVGCNLAILMAAGLLFWRVARRIADRLTAWMAAAVFLSIFGFGALVPLRNANYVCPYSHEMTHGVALSALLLYVFADWIDRPRSWRLFATGLVAGAIFLTKAEFTLAAGVALPLGIVTAGYVSKRGWRRVGGDLLIALGGALVLPLVAFGLFALHRPPTEALAATSGSIQHVWNSGLATSHFYRFMMGTLNLPLSLYLLGAACGGYVIFLLAMKAVGLFTPEAGGGRAAIAGVVCAGEVICGFLLLHYPQLRQVLRPVPIVLLIWGGAVVWQTLRRPRETADRRAALLLMFLGFSIVLAAKIILNVSVMGYGFALAAPGTILLVCAVMQWAPRALSSGGAAAGVYRAMGATAVATVAVLIMMRHLPDSRAMVQPFGRDGDTICVDESGAYFWSVIKQVESLCPKDATLAVVPEGVMVNYQLRRINPTPFINFMPPDCLIFGEVEMLGAFQRHPPDFILVLQRVDATYGYALFGKDYAAPLMQWINASYRVCWRLGETPLKAIDRGGFMLLERNDRPASATINPS